MRWGKSAGTHWPRRQTIWREWRTQGADTGGKDHKYGKVDTQLKVGSRSRVHVVCTRSDNDWSEVCAYVELGWLDANDVQVCSINAQVRPGEGVRCAWWGSRTNRSVALPPPPGRRVLRRNSNTGDGGWAPWRLVIGRDSGEASRAGLRTPAAMADPGTREAMADPGTREAMADRWLRKPWPYYFSWWPWRSRELGWLWR